MSVVKANAYGHGILEVADIAKEHSDWFGVDSIDEALLLKNHGIEKPILILGYTLNGRLRDVVENGFSQTVYNEGTIKQLGEFSNELNKKVSLHFKVETGTLQATDGFILTCNLDSTTRTGYQLVFQPGRWDRVKLFKISPKTRTEIQSYSNRLKLENVGPHLFEWTRSINGLLVVSINGQKLFQVSDNTISEPFQKISIAHIGDQVILRDIQLYDSTINDKRV